MTEGPLPTVTEAVAEQVAGFPLGAFVVAVVVGLLIGIGLSYALADLVSRKRTRSLIVGVVVGVLLATVSAALTAPWYWVGLGGLLGALWAPLLEEPLRARLMRTVGGTSTVSLSSTSIKRLRLPPDDD